MTSSPAEYRAAQSAETPALIELWSAVFGFDGSDYFRAYLEGDPWLQPQDCQVALVDGRIVAAVHLVRRPVRLLGDEMLVGGVANVATLPEHRRRGLSTELMRRCVATLDGEGFAFSALGTGVHGHYARHGWETVVTPTLVVEPDPSGASWASHPPLSPLTPEEWLTEGPRVYAAFNATQPLFFERSLEYWNGWLRIRYDHADPNRLLVGLRRNGALEGYALGQLPGEAGGTASVEEIATLQPDELPLLLNAAARIAHAAGASRLHVNAPRLPVMEEALRGMGRLRLGEDGSKMLRRGVLDNARMATVRELYASGAFCWWGPDGF